MSSGDQGIGQAASTSTGAAASRSASSRHDESLPASNPSSAFATGRVDHAAAANAFGHYADAPDPKAQRDAIMMGLPEDMRARLQGKSLDDIRAFLNEEAFRQMAGDGVAEGTKGMTPEQRKAFFARAAEGQMIKELKGKSPAQAAAIRARVMRSNMAPQDVVPIDQILAPVKTGAKQTADQLNKK